MVDVRLINYIKEQLQRGYDIQTIRNFLLTNGYNQNDVNAAIQHLQAHDQRQSSSPGQEKMLTAYVKKYLAQGYTAQQLEQSLMQRGYPPYVVQKAIKNAQKRGLRINKKILGAFIVILLLVAAIGGIAWFFPKIVVQETTEIRYDLRIDVPTISAGDTLLISNDFLGFPQKRQGVATVYYTIESPQGNTEDTWQISFGPKDAFIKNTKRSTSSRLAAGDYTLVAELRYENTVKKDTAPFTVIEEEVEERQETVTQEPTQTSDPIEEDTQQEQIEEPVEEVTSTFEAGVISSDDFELYAMAKDLAPTDHLAAVEYCPQIQDMTKKDECYSTVARLSAQKSYCVDIISDPTRDACYIDFAFNKADYSVCPEIANPFIKQSCEQLEAVAALQG